MELHILTLSPLISTKRHVRYAGTYVRPTRTCAISGADMFVCDTCAIYTCTIRTYVCVSGGKKCLCFRKIWCALFSCYVRFEIRFFALLPANWREKPLNLVKLVMSFWYLQPISNLPFSYFQRAEKFSISLRGVNLNVGINWTNHNMFPTSQCVTNIKRK